MTALAFVIAAGSAVLLTVLALLPRWVFRSLIRYQMWGLRDEIFDAALFGKIPAENVAGDLVHQVEFRIQSLSYFTLAAIALVASEEMPAERQLPDLSRLEPEQRDLLVEYRSRIDALTMRNVQWTTWPAIISVCTLTIIGFVQWGIRALKSLADGPDASESPRVVVRTIVRKQANYPESLYREDTRIRETGARLPDLSTVAG